MLREVERRPRRRLAFGRRAGRDRAHRQPLAIQAECRTRLVLAEQGRRYPARRDALGMERQEKVLDRGAGRQDEHLPLSLRAPWVVVAMRAGDANCRHDERRRFAEQRVGYLEPLPDRFRRCAVAGQVAPPRGCHGAEKSAPGRLRVEDRVQPRARVMRRRRGARRADGFLDCFARHVSGSERAD